MCGDRKSAGETRCDRDGRSHSRNQRRFDVVSVHVNRHRLVRGEKATLRLTSDEPMTVHVHGYDIETPLIPGMTATIAIAARFAGRFPVTAHIHDSSTSKASTQKHHREPTLFYLEVLP